MAMTEHERPSTGEHDPGGGSRAVGDVAVGEDAFLGGRLRAMQPRHGYRSGIDTLLLAAAVPAAPGEPCSVLDAGAGVGIAGLAVGCWWPAADLVLLERDPALAAIARQNAALNGMSERTRVVCADITAPAADLATGGLLPDSIDHAIANPPYFVEGRGIAAARAQRATSRAMAAGELEGWARGLARAVRPGGTLTMIHRASALTEILVGLERRFGGLAIRPIAALPGATATRVLVLGRKGSRAPLALLAPLVLHREDMSYTEEIAAVVRGDDQLRWP